MSNSRSVLYAPARIYHTLYCRTMIANKDKLVEKVFSSVAGKYDLMNDLMSLGIHRLWKQAAIDHCCVQNNQLILDLAGGTGDMSARLQSKAHRKPRVILADLNQAMLQAGRSRLIDRGFCQALEYVQVNAETLPFATNSFDTVLIAYGLRNVCNIQLALEQMYRVLKPGGRLVVLEFSKPIHSWLAKAYGVYSDNILPLLGQLIAKDRASYQYLVDSIRLHPGQDELLSMLETAGFENCSYHNLSAGICAIHKGFKL